MIVPKGFPTIPPDFEFETEVVRSIDGEQDLFFNWFKRKGSTSPKRVLMIIHGQGEHGARYQHFPHYLSSEYDWFLAPDLRGHGRSLGMRGHVDSFDEYVDDVLLAYKELKNKIPADTTMDWFSHSMGGTVTLRMLQMNAKVQVRNFIFSCPGIDLSMKVPFLKDLAARILNRVWGSLQLPTDLNPDHLTHDANVSLAVAKDSLHHTKGTPAFYFSFLDAMERIRQEPVSFPKDARVFLQLAGDDLIVSTPASEAWFSRLSHPHKDLREYPGLYHEIYNETVKDKLFQDWLNWVRING